MPGVAEGYPVLLSGTVTTQAYPRHPRSGTRSVNVVANRETQRATVFDCNSAVQVVTPQKGQAHWMSLWLAAYSLR